MGFIAESDLKNKVLVSRERGETGYGLEVKAKGEVRYATLLSSSFSIRDRSGLSLRIWT